MPGLAIALLTAALAAPPATLPYDEEAPIPQGYHVEQRLRLGLLISGGFTALQAIGFYAAGRTAKSDIDRTVYTMFGIVSAVPAIVLLGLGAVLRREVLVRNDIAIIPTVTPSFAGLGVSGSF